MHSLTMLRIKRVLEDIKECQVNDERYNYSVITRRHHAANLPIYGKIKLRDVEITKEYVDAFYKNYFVPYVRANKERRNARIFEEEQAKRQPQGLFAQQDSNEEKESNFASAPQDDEERKWRGLRVALAHHYYVRAFAAQNTDLQELARRSVEYADTFINELRKDEK
jgi:hypothetical protein